MSDDWGQPASDFPAEAREIPQSLDRAVKLMYLGAVLTGIGTVIGLIDQDQIREQVRESLAAGGLEITEEALRTGMVIAMATAGVIAAIVVGLWFLMAAMNRKGKPWARTTATILGAVAILSSLGGLTAAGALGVTAGSGDTIWTVINIAVAAIIIYFLWRPENNPYYASQQRRQIS